MSGDDVEQAIQRLMSHAETLTLDQRLRIAALLARPTEPETIHVHEGPAEVPVEARVLTVEETAEVLKVGRTTVYDLIKTGRLTSIMIGRLRRIRYNDVLAYLDQLALQAPG